MFIYYFKLQDKYNTCALSKHKHVGKYVYSVRNAFLSLIHILPICFDSPQVLYIYRIMAVLKVETYIIISILASPIGWAVILLIMYAETFKTNIIVFFVYLKRHNVISHWPKFSSIRVSKLILTISPRDQRKKCSIYW